MKAIHVSIMAIVVAAILLIPVGIAPFQKQASAIIIVDTKDAIGNIELILIDADGKNETIWTSNDRIEGTLDELVAQKQVSDDEYAKINRVINERGPSNEEQIRIVVDGSSVPASIYFDDTPSDSEENLSLAGSNLGSSSVIGTQIGDAIGDAANSDEEDEAVISLRPNNSDSLTLEKNSGNTTSENQLGLPQLSNLDGPSIGSQTN